MLNNHNKTQKTKSQLVFKLLKTMNPYIPNSTQSNTIKNQLYSILKSQTDDIIFQENSEQQDDQYQNNYQEFKDKVRTIQGGRIVGNIMSKVVDVMVENGVWVDAGSVRSQVEKIIDREIQAERQSRLVRNQIQQIQDNTFKRFKIQKQSIIRNNSFTPYTYIPVSSRSHINQNYSSLIKSDVNLQTTRVYDNRITQNSRKINSYVSDREQSYNCNKCANDNNKNLDAISGRFSQLRLRLSHLQSPVKTYRHQYDANKPSKLQIQKTQTDNQAILGLQSSTSFKNFNNIQQTRSRLIKSKSQLTIKKQTYQQYNKQKLNSSRGYSSVNKTKISNFNSNINESVNAYNRKVSQKLLKQTQKLDMEIMASILHKKMRQNDRSNTIASLIK